VADDRARRIAENESRFREINERLERDLRALPDDDRPVPFVCECGQASCSEPVPMLIDEYERLRVDARHFAVVAGHEIADAEDVIVTTDRYSVVRKKAPSHRIVEATEPRS
jgi:hypothetical protein